MQRWASTVCERISRQTAVVRCRPPLPRRRWLLGLERSSREEFWCGRRSTGDHTSAAVSSAISMASRVASSTSFTHWIVCVRDDRGAQSMCSRRLDLWSRVLKSSLSSKPTSYVCQVYLCNDLVYYYYYYSLLSSLLFSFVVIDEIGGQGCDFGLKKLYFGANFFTYLLENLCSKQHFGRLFTIVSTAHAQKRTRIFLWSMVNCQTSSSSHPVSVVGTRVLEYSIRYSIEYSSSKKLDSHSSINGKTVDKSLGFSLRILVFVLTQLTYLFNYLILLVTTVPSIPRYFFMVRTVAQNCWYRPTLENTDDVIRGVKRWSVCNSTTHKAVFNDKVAWI